MQRSRERVLTLILSHGKSLRWWQETGILSRELLLYLHLLRTGTVQAVLIFSYDPDDHVLVAERARHDPVFARIRMLTPDKRRTRGLGAWLWSVAGPVRYRHAIRASVAIKTNQVDSAVAALVARFATGRPLVVRLGYLLSSSYHDAGRRGRAVAARVLERAAFATARHILVSSRDIAARVGSHERMTCKVVIHPTYVDVDAFAAKTGYDFDAPLVWVGRMTPQKNLHALIRGCALAGRDLDLIGLGELEEDLRALAAGLPITVRFLGRAANEELPAMLRDHSVFILPSFYEGLPKALLEAMACGLVCVASTISGVTEVIREGDTGVLIEGFAPEDIAAAIERACRSGNATLGQAARATIEAGYSLDGHAAREQRLYAQLES